MKIYFTTYRLYWLRNHTLKCFVTNADVDFEHNATVNKGSDDLPILPSGCSILIIQLNSEILETDPLNLVTIENYVLSEEEQDVPATTPAHPAGLYALYANSLACNLGEQLWNFAWPAAVALIHPSFLPAAVVSFFMKLTIAVGGPLIGKYMDSFPRTLAYNCLSLVQGREPMIYYSWLKLMQTLMDTWEQSQVLYKVRRISSIFSRILREETTKGSKGSKF